MSTQPKKALFVGGCAAPWHRIATSAPHIEKALLDLGYAPEITGIFQVGNTDEAAGDYSALNAEKLEQVEVVVLHTTGNERQGADLEALKAWVKNGGALVGVHCAADSFKDDAEWVSMLGGSFRHHPEQLEVTVEIADNAHPITQGVSPFTVFEELYLFDHYNSSQTHLLAQTRSYDEGDGAPIPIAWTHEVGQGRIYYLSLGHNPAVMETPEWQTLFQNGVKWVTRTEMSMLRYSPRPDVR